MSWKKGHGKQEYNIRKQQKNDSNLYIVYKEFYLSSLTFCQNQDIKVVLILC